MYQCMCAGNIEIELIEIACHCTPDCFSPQRQLPSHVAFDSRCCSRLQLSVAVHAGLHMLYRGCRRAKNRGVLLLWPGSARWSSMFCTRVFLVTAAWVQNPRLATMAKRPLRTCAQVTIRCKHHAPCKHGTDAVVHAAALGPQDAYQRMHCGCHATELLKHITPWARDCMHGAGKADCRHSRREILTSACLLRSLRRPRGSKGARLSNPVCSSQSCLSQE